MKDQKRLCPVILFCLGALIFAIAGCTSPSPQPQATPTPVAQSSAGTETKPPVVPNSFKSTQDRVNAGIDFYNKEQYEAAETVLTPLVESKAGGQPEALAWQYLAQAAFAQKLPDKGAEIFLKVRARYKDDPKNLRAMVMHEGNILWKAGSYDKALAVFQELIKLGNKEQEPGVLLQMAMVHHDAGQPEQGRKLLEKIISDFSNERTIANDARCQLATYYLDKGDLDKAEETAETAEKLGADENQVANILLGVGDEMAKKGQDAQAENFFRKLLARYKKDDAKLNNVRGRLATFYLTRKNSVEAEKLLELIQSESPNDTQKQWATESLSDIKREKAGE